ncbi:dihydrofolate reductase family protein [Kribbella sp. CA-247076]|uniref:dihydrofolate reductase family protein n=1 Tax=Kribbella sp. CA-247076 TaxID=3239941 RepID=UPI003D9373B6
MGKVITASAVSVDGFITGRDPGPGRGLGDGGMLFDWYGDRDERNTRLFDTLSGRVGAMVAGRNTYDDSEGFDGGSPHPTAPLVVVTHRPVPEASERQTIVTTGIEDAVEAAQKLAGGKDVGVMGGGAVTAALQAGLIDELVLHQVPIMLGAGRPYFQELPSHIRLTLVDVVAAPGVTHLHYEVQR